MWKEAGSLARASAVAHAIIAGSWVTWVLYLGAKTIWIGEGLGVSNFEILVPLMLFDWLASLFILIIEFIIRLMSGGPIKADSGQFMLLCTHGLLLIAVGSLQWFCIGEIASRVAKRLFGAKSRERQS